VTSTKAFIKDWLPPVATRWLRDLRGGSIRFSGNYASWAEASAHSDGYDAEAILAKVLEATLAVKRGEAAYERDSVIFRQIDYVWPLLAGLMWAAARAGGRLNVLDFGGSLGSLYFQHRRFLGSLPEIHWNIVEQAHYVECGKAHIEDATLRFYPDVAACLAENVPNVILLSSVLQYLPHPVDLLDELRDIGSAVMMIDRTPIAAVPADRLLVQTVPASVCAASYPMWVFSESALLACLQRDWRMVSRYAGPEGRVCSREGLSFSFEGLLLEAC